MEYRVKTSPLQFQCKSKYWPQIRRNQKYRHGSGVINQCIYSVPLWCLHIPFDKYFKLAFLAFKVAISALSSIFSWNGKYKKLVFNVIIQFEAELDETKSRLFQGYLCAGNGFVKRWSKYFLLDQWVKTVIFSVWNSYKVERCKR